MTPEDLYLHAVINRHRASSDTGTGDGAGRLVRQLQPLLHSWANKNLESVTLSGSRPKGTALRDSDVDLFVSLSPETPGPLAAIHESLADHFRNHRPELRNVSVRIRFEDDTVDLVPGRRRPGSTVHTLWQSRHDTWLQTDVAEQIRHVGSSGLLDEILALKIWRRRHALRFPSFPLELAVIRALSPRNQPIAQSFLSLLSFLANDFPTTRLLDPANSNNVVSDLLTAEQKDQIATIADRSLRAPGWPETL